MKKRKSEKKRSQYLDNLKSFNTIGGLFENINIENGYVSENQIDKTAFLPKNKKSK